MMLKTTIPQIRRSAAVAGAALAALALADSANAGQTESATAATAPEVGDIVVTARKREERLQDVPLSITAVDGARLEKAGSTQLSDVSRSTTNVYFEAADRTKPLIFIRGIGTRSYDSGSDASVGVFVDGVHLGRFGALDLELMDIERIEVLKGPQGTLYGRNTIGGAIAVTTRDPSDAFEGKVGAGLGASAIGGDTLWNLNGSVSGPLGDNVKAGVSAAYRSRNGFQPVTGSDVRGGSEESILLRGRAVVDMPDGGRIRLTADYAHFDGPPLILVPNTLGGTAPTPGPLAPGFSPVPEPSDPYHPSSDRVDQSIVKEVYGGALEATWTWGAADFTSITAVRGLKFTERDDLDGTTLPYQIYDVREESDQISQELRATGQAGSLVWLAGVYGSRENSDRVETIDFGPASLLAFLVAPAPLTWDFGFDIKTVSLAAFGQLQWAATDRLTITVGGRYSHDRKEVTYNTDTTVPGLVLFPFQTDLDESWGAFDPSVSISYKLADDAMVYASYAKGFKSGAFQFIAISPEIANVVADPERVNAYEFGVKSSLFDRRLRLNAALFHMDYSNLQQLRLVPINPSVAVVVISNAASSRIRGFEAEAEAALSENWRLQASYGYLDARFGDYVFSPTLDFSGNRMPRSPQNSFNLALNYGADTGIGRLDARVSYNWRDKIYFEADNDQVDPESSEDPLGLLDASIALETGGFTVGLWVRNLTDERYRRQVLNSTGASQRQVWAEPRTFGIRLGYSFGN